MAKIKKKEETEKNKSKKKNSLYVGFFPRLILNFAFFAAFLTLGIMFILMSLDFIEQKSITYSEKSNLDYRVYLKENDFYDVDYLDKNMVYVASLIDKVGIDFDYVFTSDEKIDLDFSYKVVGVLSITDEQGNNSYFEKEYVLLDNKNISMENTNSQGINESIEIDYNFYNSLANRFKAFYGIDASSNFVIKMVINKENSEQNVVINKDSVMSITIPLSEKSINIAMDYKDIDKTNNLLSNSKVTVNNVVYIILSVILIVAAWIMLSRFIRLLLLLNNNRSDYDKYINRILTEYDRLIVETSTAPVVSGDNVIRIDKFQELLDVRDNLKLPIMYYVVTKHQKCYFYITYENKTYLNVLKSIDFDNVDTK